MLECGVRIPSLGVQTLVLHVSCVSVVSRVRSAARSSVCFVVLHAVRVFIGCVHSVRSCACGTQLGYSLDACCHVLCEHVAYSILISCVYRVLFCTWLVIVCWLLSYSCLCAMCSHCQFVLTPPIWCYLSIDLFVPPVPRYPPQLLPLKSPCVCSPMLVHCVCLVSCPVLSCPVLSCPGPVLSGPVLSCLSCPVLSCPVLSLSCPALPCPVLSCPSQSVFPLRGSFSLFRLYY